MTQMFIVGEFQTCSLYPRELYEYLFALWQEKSTCYPASLDVQAIWYAVENCAPDSDSLISQLRLHYEFCMERPYSYGGRIGWIREFLEDIEIVQDYLRARCDLAYWVTFGSYYLERMRDIA